MNSDPDAILTEVKELSERVAAENLTSKERKRLEQRREELRTSARDHALSSRHPDAVRRQIEALEQRHAQIMNQLIKPGSPEKHLGKTIQDPAAYRRNINAELEKRWGPELDEIERQLTELRGYGTTERESRA